VNERQRIDAVLESISRFSTVHIDKRPWWIRLLASIKLDIKFNKTLKNPIKIVMLKGKVDF
jgi:hypothetical protein